MDTITLPAMLEMYVIFMAMLFLGMLFRVLIPIVYWRVRFMARRMSELYYGWKYRNRDMSEFSVGTGGIAVYRPQVRELEK